MSSNHTSPIRAQDSLNRLWVLVSFIGLLSGCAPPELSASQENLVRSCLQPSEPDKENPACKGMTKTMQDAFFAKHPEVHDQMLTERKAEVAEQIAKDQQRQKQLAQCVDDMEAGKSDEATCKEVKPHEVRRETENRRRTRCSQALLDSQPDASQRCAGLSEEEVKEEVRAELVKREAKLGRPDSK